MGWPFTLRASHVCPGMPVHTQCMSGGGGADEKVGGAATTSASVLRRFLEDRDGVAVPGAVSGTALA